MSEDRIRENELNQYLKSTDYGRCDCGKQAEDECSHCGKELCYHCIEIYKGKTYCAECIEEAKAQDSLDEVEE